LNVVFNKPCCFAQVGAGERTWCFFWEASNQSRLVFWLLLAGVLEPNLYRAIIEQPLALSFVLCYHPGAI